MTPWTVAHQAPLPMGFSTGVGCHVLLQGIFLTKGSNPGFLHCRQILYYLNHQESAKVRMLVAQSYPTLGTPWTIAFQAPLSMEFSRQNTKVAIHSLLHGIFPTWGSDLGLLHCRQILYHLSHQRGLFGTEPRLYPLELGLAKMGQW